MKKIYTPILIFIIALQSCVSVRNLPANLPTSLLLVEKKDVNIKSTDGKGFMKNSLRKLAESKNEMNEDYNNLIEKRMKDYPFKYKIVSSDKIGEYIDPNKQTYLLKNGKTFSVSTGASHSNTTYTDVFIEDLTDQKNKIKKIATKGVGIISIAKKLCKKAKKMK